MNLLWLFSVCIRGATLSGQRSGNKAYCCRTGCLLVRACSACILYILCVLCICSVCIREATSVWPA